jgi:hypothetical protein
MSGNLHSIITRRQFVFTNVSTSVSLEIPLVRAMDVTGAKALELLVRVHSLTIGAGASVAVKAYAVSLTSEEPDTDFLSPSAASPTALATITLNNSSSAPSLQLASVTTPFGHMVRIGVSGTQPAGAQTISVVLSVDLLVYDN